MSEPCDRRHPLWEMHLIDGHRGGSVVYSRLHHALADGIALNEVLLSLTDATPEGDLDRPEPGEQQERRDGMPAGARGLIGSVGSAIEL